MQRHSMPAQFVYRSTLQKHLRAGFCLIQGRPCREMRLVAWQPSAVALRQCCMLAYCRPDPLSGRLQGAMTVTTGIATRNAAVRQSYSPVYLACEMVIILQWLLYEN